LRRVKLNRSVDQKALEEDLELLTLLAVQIKAEKERIQKADAFGARYPLDSKSAGLPPTGALCGFSHFAPLQRPGLFNTMIIAFPARFVQSFFV
jgi:hypothetical protein